MEGNEKDISKEKKQDNKTVIIGVAIIILTIVIISLIFQNQILGRILEMDVEQRFKEANRLGIEHKPTIEITLNDEKQEITVINYKMIYDDNDERANDMVDRSIKVFEKLFTDPDKKYSITNGDNSIIIEFTWKPEKGI